MARRYGNKARRKREHWTADEARRMLTAWEGSGLTVAAFCRKRGIRAKRLYWWRRRLEWTDAEPDRHLAEAVLVPSLVTGAAVKLHLRSGDWIEVESPVQVEADWLVGLARGLCSTTSGSTR
jgi:hypothetical protein